MSKNPVTFMMDPDGWIDLKPYTPKLTIRATDINLKNKRVIDLGGHRKQEAKATESIRIQAQSWNIANLSKK